MKDKITKLADPVFRANPRWIIEQLRGENALLRDLLSNLQVQLRELKGKRNPTQPGSITVSVPQWLLNGPRPSSTYSNDTANRCPCLDSLSCSHHLTKGRRLI